MVAALMVAVFGLLGAGFVVGYLSNSFFQSTITIVISDYSTCSDGSYTVVLNDRSINYSGKQTERNHTAGSVPDGVVGFLARVDGQVDDAGLIDYRIKAEYSDCETIISEKRQVKPRRFIHESISDDRQVSQFIRH